MLICVGELHKKGVYSRDLNYKTSFFKGKLHQAHHQKVHQAFRRFPCCVVGVKQIQKILKQLESDKYSDLMKYYSFSKLYLSTLEHLNWYLYIISVNSDILLNIENGSILLMVINVFSDVISYLVLG